MSLDLFRPAPNRSHPPQIPPADGVVGGAHLLDFVNNVKYTWTFFILESQSLLNDSRGYANDAFFGLYIFF